MFTPMRAALLLSLLFALPARAELAVESLQLLLFDPQSGELSPLEAGGNVVSRQVVAIVHTKGRATPTGRPLTLTLMVAGAAKKTFTQTAVLDTGLGDGQSALFYLAPFTACAVVKFTASLHGLERPSSKSFEVPFHCGE